MSGLLGIVGILAGLVNLVCFIMVLIKLAQAKGAGHAILGFLCSLYTFVWGWQNSKSLGVNNIMLIWTGALLLGIVLNVVLAA